MKKLTSDHINVTPYSVMRVNLAAQVLTETVGNVLNLLTQKKLLAQLNFELR